MPPKPKITKEILLEHAFHIAEVQGIDAVTSRSVANAVGCSIQPVFSHFATMEDLRKATFEYACDKFVSELLPFEKDADFFSKVSKWVIDLARNKPNLFRLIYLSNGFQENNFQKLLMNYETNQKVIEKMMKTSKLDEQVCKDILMRRCLFLLGISTMICVNQFDISDEQVSIMMKQTVSDMVQGAIKTHSRTEGED